tara:strand:+ start:614 stop:733 length:120 start_codon:yes stop_codon:yes gene_type:complete
MVVMVLKVPQDKKELQVLQEAQALLVVRAQQVLKDKKVK